MPNLPSMDMPRTAPALAVALFYRDVLWAGLVLLLPLAALLVLSRARGAGEGPARPEPAPAGRRLLAQGLGCLWVLDGLLQLQPGMVTGFVSGLVAPLLAGQPPVLAAVMGWGVRLWGVDPIVWNVVATYTQIVIGLLILAGGEGPLRRAGLWGSLVWGLVVWVFGEAMGSVFVGGSWLLGAPGSVFFYMTAAALLLLPAGAWRRGRWRAPFGRGMAALWFLCAGLQAWPAAGYWTRDGLRSLVSSMAQMPQPSVFSAPLTLWARALGAHPAAWNAGLVVGLALLGIAWLLWPRSRWLWTATIVWELLTWWFGQDFGVLGGMGTDPNSGPVLVLLVAAYARAAKAAGRAPVRGAPPRAVPALPGGEVR